ncbi:polysaccharide pyruvyl transferase family protein [Chryseobacterium sp. H3056]|uniref:Polysaccharide pyruvyl transferase family protein n=1 Tax=Kaistella daneshvariae TaxID=2487074 RepID=A0A3N0WZ00_9FLAO|nr:polysaccharide pyruvyl transferase family protein [Kaistella daneshvariae]ROI09229.1 polysaccharide pyruvyl transferase family protein [Kaistella daneshvariae]
MKILIYLHSGSLNRGCEALARTAAKVIHENEELGEAALSLASFAPETDRELPLYTEVFDMNSIPVAKGSLDYLRAAVQNKLFKSDRLAIRKSAKNFISRIHRYDVFVSIGGDAYCYGEQPVWYELHRAIKEKGKIMVLWGASIGPEDLSPAKIADLKNYDLILARESLTADLLKSHGLHQTRLVADGAFLLDKEELPLPEGWVEGKMVGMNFSPLVYSRNPKARGAFENLLQHILDTTDLHIALTPHVTFDGNNDFEVLTAIYEKFEGSRRVILLPDNLNALQYKGFIARMKYFIGARTHATIAAYSNAVPVMVLGYSIKSKGIAKDLFGYERLVLGIEEISDSQKLISKFEEMKRDEQEIRNTLQSRLPEIKALARQSGEYLAELFAKKDFAR